MALREWIVFLSFLAIAISLFNIFTYHGVYITQVEHMSQNVFSGETYDRRRDTKDVASKEKSLSVLILTFNSSTTLRAILSSFLTMSPPVPVEVLVIDNGCFPQTIRLLSEIRPLYESSPSGLPSIFSIVHLQLCNNTQYARAYNLATDFVSPASGWFLLLNDDVIPRPHFLENFFLQAALSASLGHEVGAIGCKLLFPNHRIVEAGSVIRADGSTDNFLRSPAPAPRR
jgi:glycosyltransferase involved in cell wall biosynthesis